MPITKNSLATPSLIVWLLLLAHTSFFALFDGWQTDLFQTLQDHSLEAAVILVTAIPPFDGFYQASLAQEPSRAAVIAHLFAAKLVIFALGLVLLIPFIKRQRQRVIEATKKDFKLRESAQVAGRFFAAVFLCLLVSLYLLKPDGAIFFPMDVHRHLAHFYTLDFILAFQLLAVGHIVAYRPIKSS